MNALCPSCNHEFPRKERGRELGGLWNPRTTQCPGCQSTLQWKLWPWRLQWIAAALAIPAILRPTPPPIRVACIVGALLCGLAIWQFMALIHIPTPSTSADAKGEDEHPV